MSAKRVEFSSRLHRPKLEGGVSIAQGLISERDGVRNRLEDQVGSSGPAVTTTGTVIGIS
jgi:hypothetical protein